MSKISLREIYEKLLAHFGFRNWWPGDTPFEICVGAVLTQNTNWRNVEKAIANLKEENCLSPSNVIALKDDDLAQLIRPAGYYNLKAKRLKSVTRYLIETGGSDLTGFKGLPLEKLRSELLSVYGVGAETADSILLYALGRRVFVIDAYTKRIFYRLGYTEENASYNELQAFFVENITPSMKLYKDFHAQIVALGATTCKPKPRCDSCPLQSDCEKSVELFT